MTEKIYIQVEPQVINYVNRIMEGYEYLGVVSTVNKAEGILLVRVTPDTAGEVKEILNHLAVKITYFDSDTDR
ncbi:MAG: DUF4911 domain-containing protein [Veillonellales bacterium]